MDSCQFLMTVFLEILSLSEKFPSYSWMHIKLSLKTAVSGKEKFRNIFPFLLSK